MFTPGKWLVSADEERWSYAEEFNSREEAIAGAADVLGMDAGDTFYVGRIRTPVYEKPDAEDIIERVRDQMYDSEEAMEDCSWLEDVDHKQEAELQAAINQVWDAWIKKHGFEPDWFMMCDVTTEHLPETEGKS